MYFHEAADNTCLFRHMLDITLHQLDIRTWTCPGLRWCRQECAEEQECAASSVCFGTVCRFHARDCICGHRCVQHGANWPTSGGWSIHGATSNYDWLWSPSWIRILFGQTLKQAHESAVTTNFLNTFVIWTGVAGLWGSRLSTQCYSQRAMRSALWYATAPGRWNTAPAGLFDCTQVWWRASRRHALCTPELHPGYTEWR